MTIYNKDGSVYKIRKPNPLMITQDLSDNQYIMHNFFYEEFILGNLIVKKPEPKEIIKVKIKEVEPVFILPEPVIQKPIVEPKPEKTVENWITAKYLKAKVVIVKDELYGDERQKTIYEDPANLKFIEVFKNDIEIKFWTFDEVQRESIVYVKEDKRWWKVRQSEIYKDGFMTVCYPSSLQPHLG